jgi:hypothetical protein
LATERARDRQSSRRRARVPANVGRKPDRRHARRTPWALLLVRTSWAEPKKHGDAVAVARAAYPARTEHDVAVERDGDVVKHVVHVLDVPLDVLMLGEGAVRVLAKAHGTRGQAFAVREAARAHGEHPRSLAFGDHLSNGAE